MTTVDAGELSLELGAAAPEVARPYRSPGGALLWRRMLHDGRIRGVAIAAGAISLAAVWEPSTRRLEVAALISALAWVLAVHVVERSLRTVNALAGPAGIAAGGALLGAAIASGVSFWLGTGVEGRAEVLSMTGLVLLVILAVEGAKARIAVLRSRVLLVGGGRSTLELLQLLGQNPRKPFAVVGVVDDDPGSAGSELAEWLGPVGTLHGTMGELKPDLVVIAAERGRPEVFAELASVAELPFRVVGLAEFYEHAFGRVPVRNVTDAWFMSVLHLYQRVYSRIAKRGFDIAVASFGLLVTAPLFPLIALFVRSTGREVLYRQTRLGEHGKPFSILKFRTMTVDAESDGAVWAQESDPRATTVGLVLRRTRLDELPQLFNVLAGNMSIVGPRPERPEFHIMLEEAVPFWSRRHLLKPGITGWAQLRSTYAADAGATEEKLAYDLWYLRHQSIVVDFLICIRTLPLLLLAVGR